MCQRQKHDKKSEAKRHKAGGYKSEVGNISCTAISNRPAYSFSGIHQ